MKRNLTVAVLASAILALSACSSDDDDDGAGDAPVEQPDGGDETGADGDGDGDGADGDGDGADGDGDGADGDGAGGDGDAGNGALAGSFQVTFTNLTTNQLMTEPVAALHDPSVHIFQIGETATDPVRDIAETGNNDALVAFAGANPEVISDAGVAGAGAIFPGGQVSINLTTTLDGQVFSAVNMVICTNDGMVGVDSLALPNDNEPVVITQRLYDAGTRDNSGDAQSFFPPPCRVGDATPPPATDPRMPIALHPGQMVPNTNATGPLGNDNWNLEPGQEVLRIEIVRN